MSWQATETADQDYPRTTRVVQVVIAINVAIAFLAATIVQSSELGSLFAFRAGPLSETWWSAFTYMFLHAGLWHLAMNMYSLWLFGPRLEHLWGARSFALFYLWCGIGGAVFHALFGGLASMVGASAAIFGVMLAYAMHWPKDEIYLFGVVPMRVSTLVLMLGLLNLFMGYTAGAGGVAYFAHLGGFAFAFLYLKKPQHVSIDQLRQRVSPAPDVSDDMTPRPAPKPSTRSRHRDEVDEIVAQSKAAVGKRVQLVPGKKPEVRDARGEELDRVLDKISQQGLSSLTPDERKLLDEMSKQLRDQ
ncbi:MAG TPA: rhomboid family intramembrane serine protease [Gemmatimonadaceae bacterium]|nr:rhomboid family intramembrane serine protease [Gemmatimonadaceae bacterium]